MPPTCTVDTADWARQDVPGGPPPLTVLCVGPSESEHQSLREILRTIGWELLSVRTVGEAWARLLTESVPVVISECDLPDGNWQQLLNCVSLVPVPPHLIVSSRVADARLWAEVLNLGGSMCSRFRLTSGKSGWFSPAPGVPGTNSVQRRFHS